MTVTKRLTDEEASTMNILGYSDRLSVACGEDIRFMVSCRAPHYEARLVRLLHGDDNPRGPGLKTIPVPSAIDGRHAGHVQSINPGSCAQVGSHPALAGLRAVSVHLWLQSTTPAKPRQVLFALGSADDGFELLLDHGHLALEVAGRRVATLARPVVAHQWFAIAAVLGTASGHAFLQQVPCTATAREHAAQAHAPLEAGPLNSAGLGVTMAASWRDDSRPPADFFNGKIDNPSLFARALGEDEIATLDAGAPASAMAGTLAAWEFGRDIGRCRISDTGPHGLHGLLRNRPTRAVTGHRWDGSEFAWRHAPGHYSAIHFHEDDLDDAGWAPSLALRLPHDLESGVYAVHLACADGSDYLPFFVRPPAGIARSRILFLAPTFSYLAYANEQMFAVPAVKDVFRRMNAGVLGTLASDYPCQPQDRYIVAHGLRSLYDTHVDGSGVCHASRLRPLLNVRPAYAMPALDLGEGSPHQFNADLHLIDWLAETGHAHDVATDEDLHREGRALLDRYDVVITGTHCEYVSGAMLDALADWLVDGGRLMYLGGNGFYWVTDVDSECGHAIEIRRQGPSTRTWDARPGEGHLSSSGEPGGLWRHRGRAPQTLVGVGFTAQGTGPGRPYRRERGAADPRAAFVLDGLAEDELIGDFPSLVNTRGAASFEFDRCDPALGSPTATIVIASARGFDDSYQHVSEEVLISDSAQGGSVNAQVRADMVLLPYPNGGAVFAPGSIAWCASLSWNGYDNSVSRITRNVLERFLDPTPV